LQWQLAVGKVLNSGVIFGSIAVAVGSWQNAKLGDYWSSIAVAVGRVLYSEILS
jgi:hypothetical protein